MANAARAIDAPRNRSDIEVVAPRRVESKGATSTAVRSKAVKSNAAKSKGVPASLFWAVLAAALVALPVLAPGALALAETVTRDDTTANDDTPAISSQDSGYRAISPTTDGVGKSYDGREIARVMGFAGAAWLERPEREAEERPDWLVAELHLRPNMSVADIGAGSGYLTRRLALEVPQGHVYAVDLQPEMVELLKKMSAETHFANVSAVQGTAKDVNLPPASVDLAILVDVYHELEYPREIVLSILRALKPTGRLVLVEYRGEDPRVPIKVQHKMTVRQIRREMADFPLDFERADERLPLQHIMVFRKR